MTESTGIITRQERKQLHRELKQKFRLKQVFYSDQCQQYISRADAIVTRTLKEYARSLIIIPLPHRFIPVKLKAQVRVGDFDSYCKVIWSIPFGPKVVMWLNANAEYNALYIVKVDSGPDASMIKHSLLSQLEHAGLFNLTLE